VRGYIAVSRGLIAVGTGDARAARRFADEAQRIAPTEPLTLLLSAQASQLAGDRASAERTFQTMASRQDTRLLGLHGLFIEAQRRDDMRAARLYAEEAAKSAPAPAWAGQAVFDARCAGGDWNGALAQLDRNMKAGLVDRAAYQRQRAVLLTTRAQAADVHDPASARALALEAVRLAPTLIPAAALAGRLLGELGDLRRAARIVEAAWKANPHPELADTYAHLRPGDSARERLARVETLAQMTPGHIEGALAVARAAVDAQEFAAARAALAPLLSAPTQRVAILMAELEETESAPRSGLDRRRADFRALDAGLAGLRPARCLPVARSAGGPWRRRRWRAGRGRGEQGAAVRALRAAAGAADARRAQGRGDGARWRAAIGSTQAGHHAARGDPAGAGPRRSRPRARAAARRLATAARDVPVTRSAGAIGRNYTP
jgi:uncharacterized protein HemY